MATLMIRNFDDALHIRLKAPASANHRSMEEEARYLLRQGLVAVPTPSQGFGQAMQALFAPVGGFAFSRIQDEAPREPPDFAE